MSVDYTVYVGPWFLCRCGRVREAEAPTWCCVNAYCSAYGEPARRDCASCSLCGRGLEERRDPDRGRDAVDPHNVPVDDGRLTAVWAGGDPDGGALAPGVHAWLPNLLRGPGGRQLRFGRSRPAAWIPLGDLPTQESRWLQAEYRAELAALHDAYGAEHVEVGWGVLTYVS